MYIDLLNNYPFSDAEASKEISLFTRKAAISIPKPIAESAAAIHTITKANTWPAGDDKKSERNMKFKLRLNSINSIQKIKFIIFFLLKVIPKMAIKNIVQENNNKIFIGKSS